MKALCCPKVRLGHRKFSITTSLTLTSSSKIDLPSGGRVSGVGYDTVLAMAQSDESIRAVPLIGASVSVRHVAGPDDHPMKVPRVGRLNF
jgi:hypothetical protein